MSNLLNKLGLMLALIIAIPSLAYANYTITPIKVNIKPNSMTSSLTVHNNNDSSRHFQITVWETDKENSVESQKETKDLIVSPSQFEVGAKKAHMVRITLRDKDKAFKHMHYVLSVKELPHGPVEAGTVKVVTDFRVPVMVGEDTGAEQK